MARHIDNEVAYYYDSHPTEVDLMGETSVHARLVRYLMEVFSWLFRGQLCAIHENLNFHLTDDEYDKPVAPDIAVIKGVAFEDVTSWHVGTTGPAPQVVFEIASQETWNKDLDEKPGKYAVMGVHEYFAYDPNVPPLARSRLQRLFGWQLDNRTGMMRPMPVGPQGALWSSKLDSWLVPDLKYIRLYDAQRQVRLTEAQAEAEARRAETRRADAEAEARRALAEKLRSLGIDPDQL